MSCVFYLSTFCFFFIVAIALSCLRPSLSLTSELTSWQSWLASKLWGSSCIRCYKFTEHLAAVLFCFSMSGIWHTHAHRARRLPIEPSLRYWATTPTLQLPFQSVDFWSFSCMFIVWVCLGNNWGWKYIKLVTMPENKPTTKQNSVQHSAKLSLSNWSSEWPTWSKDKCQRN